MAYRLAAGPGWLVDRARPLAPPDPVGGVVLTLAALGALHRLLWWRGRGLVLLVGGHRRWEWRTATAKAAYATADAVTAAIESGRWVPGAGPPPDPLPTPAAR